MPKALVAASLSALLIAAAGDAQAAFVTYTLDQTNINDSLPDGTSYAEVRIDDNTAGRLTFTVTVLPALAALAVSNFGLQVFGFNVVGANPLLDAAASNSQWSLPGGWRADVAPPPNQMDGFGRFEVQVGATGSSRQQPLVFQIIGTGLTLSSFNEASSNNATQGNVRFAAHITGFSAGNDSSGYFGGSTLLPAPVPLPSVALFVPAWLGIAAFMLARRRQTAAWAVS